MIKAMEREVARFVQSRFDELRVSRARYEDLLAEANESYSNYLKLLNEEFKNILSKLKPSFSVNFAPENAQGYWQAN